MTRTSIRVASLSAALVLIAPVQALAGHGPTRDATSPCNGKAGVFTVNNVLNEDVRLGVTPTHALLRASGHVFLQMGNLPPSVKRIDFKFNAADPGWTLHSANNPVQRSAITATEDPTRDADSDLWLGNTALIPIPTDVVPDGNYVATLEAQDSAGATLATLCVDAIVDNNQSADRAVLSNANGAEPAEVTGAFGFDPQPVVYRPGVEPNGYASSYPDGKIRVEFGERLNKLTIQRKVCAGGCSFQNVTLQANDFRRPHLAAGGRVDGGPAETASEKVWGPGYTFDAAPGTILKIVATDLVGKTYNSGEFKV